MLARADLRLNVMTRKRYTWDVECEKNEQTTSKGFFNELNSIRGYFYSYKQIKAFKDVESMHDHSSADTYNKFHDDNHHNGGFHVHMEDSPVELVIGVIQFNQAVCLLYWVSIMSIFLLQAAKRDRVQLT